MTAQIPATRCDYRRLAVAVDGSPAADAAVTIALSLVDEGGELEVVHAVDRRTAFTSYVAPHGSYLTASEALVEFERELFRSIQNRSLARGVVAHCRVAYGPIAASISQFAASSAADILVMGKHEDHGLAWATMDGISDVVLRTSRTATVITGHFADPKAVFDARSILVAVDGAKPSIAAVRVGLDLARRTAGVVTFATVVEREAEKRGLGESAQSAACNDAAAAQIPAERLTLHGDAATAITTAAQSRGTDLIVVGTHGYVGAARRRLGSVAEHVVREAACPVMVVPKAVGA